jgi:hypothetical protein
MPRAAHQRRAVPSASPSRHRITAHPELLTEVDRLHARGGCAGNVPLLMKDVVLFVTLVYFLKQDVERVRVSSEKASVERPLRQIRHNGNHADYRVNRQGRKRRETDAGCILRLILMSTPLTHSRLGERNASI